MRSTGIPIYSYPTTAILVDDSTAFLTNFSLQLDNQLALRLFSFPHDALACIKNSEDSSHLSERSFDFSQELGGNPITNQTVTLNLATVQDEVYNPKRFSEISVVVVDYDMPGMTGIDLCRKLANKPIKKILLTDKGHEKIVIAAFNEGIIDHFIQKQDKNVVSLIDETIKKMQKKYFLCMSKDMRAVLAQEAPSFISDPLFCEFFDQLCVENDIVEYYLTELTGSFLLIDSHAQSSLLIVKCYEDLNIHYEFAQDNGAPESVLEDIRSGNKIPFAWKADDYFKLHSAEEWKDHVYPAEEIQGKEIYYYSFIKDPETAMIDPRRIYSYQQYLEQLRESNKFRKVER